MLKFFRNRSVLVLWLLSYILILCVPLVVTQLIVRETTALTEANMLALSEANLTRTQEGMDRVFYDIRAIARSLMTSNQALSLQYATRPFSATKLEKIGQFQTELRSKVTHNQMIREINVYFRYSGIVASSKEFLGVVGDFESYAFKTYKLAPEALREMTAAQKDMYVALIGADSEATDMVALVSSSYAADPEMVFLFVLDTARFRDILSDETSGTPILWAESDDGKILASFDTLALQNGTSADVRKLLSGDLSPNEIVITQVTSPLTSWRFSSAIATHQFQAPRYIIWRSYIMCLIVSLLLGLPFSIYFARRNYKPVKRMTEQLRLDARHSEYNAIDTALQALIKSEQESNWQVREQGQALRHAVLSRIMRGKISSTQQLLGMFQDCGIVCPTQRFLFVGVYVYSFGPCLGSVSDEGQDNEGAENEELLRYIISSVTEESIHAIANAYAFSLDEMVYCLVCPRTEENTEVFQQKLYDTCVEAARFIHVHADLTIGYYLSDLYEGDLGTQAVYSAAQDALWGVGLMENIQQGSVLTRAMLADLGEGDGWGEGMTAVKLSMLKRVQYAHAVLRGDFAEADKVYTSLCYASALSGEHCFTNAQSAAAILLSTVAEQGFTQLEQTKYRLHEELTAAVIQAADAPALHQTMRDAQIRLYNLADQKNTLANDTLYQEILQFIAAHYQEQELSVGSVCDAFRLSASGILKLFKQYGTTSVFETIQQARLSAAQELLRHSEKTIEEIAIECGYGNSLSLIRAFKRTQGITPTGYRKSVNKT